MIYISLLDIMRKLIITKEQAERLKSYFINEEISQMPVPKKANKPYVISPEKVTIVQRFLDNNFKKGNYEDIGPDGFPQKTPIVGMLSSDGQVLKNMYIDQLKDLLIDKFQKMFTDEDERSAFFDKVIDDWFNGKIGLFGMLSVNHLNENNISEKLPSVRKEVNISPTDGQKEAGNYKKGHISIQGMDITIEQPKGSYRKGKDRNGKEWKTLMKNDYGYFTKSKGKDGDAVDVFLGPHIDDFDKVYVVDQNNGSREFDESKVMLGFNSKAEAKKAYLSNYSKDWKGFRTITGVSLKLFKKWLYRGRKQQQPFSKYVEIKRNQLDEAKQLTPMDDFRDFTATDMGRHLEPGRFSNMPRSAEPGFDGWKRVRKGTKMNLQNEDNGNLLSKHWFDWIGYMIDGIAIVQDNGKWNYVKEDGSILSNQWFDDVEEFDGDTADVLVKGNDGEDMAKKIDRNGNLLG